MTDLGTSRGGLASVSQIAELTGYSTRKVRQMLTDWAADGLIGHFGNGSGKRWPLDRVHELLTAEICVS